MKISKLFHWLYAILMLLPVVIGLTYYLMSIVNADRFAISSINDLIANLEVIFDNSLFSWAKTSFLNGPFDYITYMFGFSNNTITYFLSYWLTISIIWLVFDVIMYVPLLVHRWLDKGIIE